MLRERLIGNGTTISRSFGLYERQNFTITQLLTHEKRKENSLQRL